MTSRSATRRRNAGGPPPARRLPVIAIAVGALALVVAVGLVIALGGGGDSDDTSGELAFGTVAIEGFALPGFGDPAADPAIGQVAPLLEGQALDGSAASVGRGQPTIVAFLAHWCPHCQVELPLLVQLAADGNLDGVRVQVVLTGTNADAPNYPPAAWLEREGWHGDVLVDDADDTAGKAYGLAGYPFLVTLDADGKVLDRRSGEQPAAQLEALAKAARDAS